MSVKPKSGSHNTRRRNLLIAILVIVLVASSLFAYMIIMNSGSVHVKNEVELRKAVNDAPFGSPVVIIFDKDIALTGPLTISVGKNITFVSNSGNEFFKLIGAADMYVIGVDGGGVLTLESVIVTHASGASGRGVEVYVGGTFILSGGEISGNSFANDFGGGVLNQGTFVMNSGKISGNTASVGGGVDNIGTFTMSGGEITNNNAGYSGGGVRNYGTFNRFGGTISGNTVNGNSDVPQVVE